MRNRLSALCFLLMLVFSVWSCVDRSADRTDTPVEPRVQTSYGVVEGTVGAGGVLSFLGVPYARPPSGPLRWAPPQAPLPWNGTRSAKAFGLICPQPPPDPLLSAYLGQRSQAMGEDCLSLNVWTTAKRTSSAQPVMVWIHGGAFVSGSGSERFYDGATLAGEGVVLVTINYRLGPLGFLAHPALSAEQGGSSGDYGLQDQIMALGWVRDNIRSFGGDPGNVTVFGESAGGVSVAALLTSPEAKGLFHKAIIESGAAPRLLRRLDRPVAGLRSAQELGVAYAKTVLGGTASADTTETVAVLRKLPWERLLAADETTGTAGLAALPSNAVSRYLIQDGKVLTAPPGAVFDRGAQTKVPLLIGTMADEGSLFARSAGLQTRAAYLAFVAQVFPDHRDEILAAYPARDDAQAAQSAAALVGDLLFQVDTRRMAGQMAAAGLPTYRYVFAREIPAAAVLGLGAFHGSEIPYVFGTLGQFGSAPEDQRLSELVRGYWTRFAKTGDPNGGGAPAWPRYETSSDRVLVLDAVPRAEAGFRKAKLDLLERRLRLERLVGVTP